MAPTLHDEATQARRREHIAQADALYAEYRAALYHPTWVHVGLCGIWLFFTAFFGRCLQAVNPLTGLPLDLLVSGLVALVICIGIRHQLDTPAREAWNTYQAHAALPLPGDAPKEPTVIEKCTGDFVRPEDITSIP